MTVVSRSPPWGEKSAPRIIRPNTYINVTDAAISAPRPGRLSSTCPAPGIIHASTTAGSQGVEGASGALEGAVAGGVTGKAPGLSLTNSFYPIRRRPLNA